MSSQRGNVQRTRPQKYQNKFVFKNNLNDTSKRTKAINSIEVSEVCKQCKDVIEWKIRYKKFKPLSQPKTCSNCHQKAIKQAYHVLCNPCGESLGVCCKCRKSNEIIHKSIQLKPKEDVLAMMKKDLKFLPERKRRAFYRYVDTFYDATKRRKYLKLDDKEKEEEEKPEAEEEESPEAEEESENFCEETGKQKRDYLENYLEKIRQKLEELGKGVVMFDDGFGGKDSDDESETSGS